MQLGNSLGDPHFFLQLQPESTTSEAAALVVSTGQEPDQGIASLGLLHAQVSQTPADTKVIPACCEYLVMGADKRISVSIQLNIPSKLVFIVVDSIPII